jgi:hypothetical protein
MDYSDAGLAGKRYWLAILGRPWRDSERQGARTSDRTRQCLALAGQRWQLSYISNNSYNDRQAMATTSVVISMRLPSESGKRLKRMAKRHGWTPSDTSARLVEEGLRRSEFAFIDFRDSPAGRQAYIQGSSLAVWEVMLVAGGYRNDAAAVAKHLTWQEIKVQAAFNYAQAFPEEIEEALAEQEAVDFNALHRMIPQAQEMDLSKRTPFR